MKILIVGNGGREHTLLWKLRRDAPGAEFHVTRPNGGMTGVGRVDLSPEAVDGVAAWSDANGIDLVVVGPEAPLAAGLADRLAERRVPCFGPSAAAAEIESSKAFAKGLMERHGIPTAAFRAFTDADAAEAYVRERGGPLVVKASGLAAGKGVILCDTTERAVDAVREMLRGGAFGGAGEEVVVEERMEGEELSVFALTDGEHVATLLPSQDHKRVGEAETGPNTGGMGAYAPVSPATRELVERIEDTVLRPTVAAMREEGRPFRGLLYAGLMLTDEGPKVVEFNCRFGDPETQVVLPLLRSSLLEPVREIAAGGSIAGWAPEAADGAAATTVLASGGYPGAYEKGKPIDVPADVEEDERLIVFHAGTRRTEDGTLVTSGGRVLAVTALAPTVLDAATLSGGAAARISFEGRHFRRDIGWREVARAAGTGA